MLNTAQAIQSKKDSLRHHKPGLVCESEPKVIWVKMIERVGGEYDRALTVRYRFNSVVEELLTERKKHYIFDVGKTIAEFSYFTVRNKLNEDGKMMYWSQINKIVQLFKANRDQFQPQCQDVKLKLPPLPPEVRKSSLARSKHKHSS